MTLKTRLEELIGPDETGGYARGVQPIRNKMRKQQREAYEREWGLGLVTSVDQGDGYVWVTKIMKDEDGYYLAPEAVYRNKSRLRATNHVIADIPVSLGVPKNGE